LPVFADREETETNEEIPNESTFEEQEDCQADDITDENAINNSERKVRDSEDDLIEKLLRQAEKNLSTLDSKDHIPPRIKLDPGPLPKPYFESTKYRNKLLTEQLEDSIVVSANNGTIKRLEPSKSRLQTQKVTLLFPHDSMMLSYCSFGAILQTAVLARSICDDT
jgi:hypothetical protein